MGLVLSKIKQFLLKSYEMDKMTYNLSPQKKNIIL